MMNIEERLSALEDRNKKVELDKAWETSIERKLLILILTYLIIGFYFQHVLKVNQPWLNAVIPSLGYLLSTLTLNWFKQVWSKRRSS